MPLKKKSERQERAKNRAKTRKSEKQKLANSSRMSRKDKNKGDGSNNMRKDLFLNNREETKKYPKVDTPEEQQEGIRVQEEKNNPSLKEHGKVKLRLNKSRGCQRNQKKRAIKKTI